MVYLLSTLSVLGLLASASARPVDDYPPSGAKAVYFLSNAKENSVVSLAVASDGTLSEGSNTPTGGKGGNGIDGMTNEPSGPDALFSQGSVAVAGNTLVAVNAGSNTVSLFTINESDPTDLKLIGEPCDTLGDFPLSVGISAKLSQACVANSGTRAGIACFEITPTGLAPLDYELRPFEIDQTTPPVGATNTVSHTFFNEDSTALLTTVKGDGTAENVGYLSSFPVVDGAVSRDDVRSSPNGTAVLFGSVNIPGTSSILATDASFGAAVIDVDSCGNGEAVALVPVEDQMATCWAAFSETTGTVFVTDVAVNHVVEIDPTDGSIVDDFHLTNGNAGMIDLAAAGDFVYALAPGNATASPAIAVLDVSSGKGSAQEIQNYEVATVMGGNPQGMAVYV
ncbi:hypothetical protein FQN54_007705 [Arachnomyces sp. PD_36]|nr:hypothetical protein FQN54_007705 [Arachnomyces sp. PD_36]